MTGGRDNEHEKAEAHGRGTAGDLSGHGGPGLDGKHPGGTGHHGGRAAGPAGGVAAGNKRVCPL
ncbi:hypothetical protein HMPREF1546_02722 [Oscillibacter sp. KLE 1745]|nr:hypothetical protein HMPREF1546_02722 [Oscillibacter sp. KLE 1745]